MQKINRLLYFLVLLKFVLPFLIQNGTYEPHRDEFLYLAEARHMAWGYMEVPPLLSVFAWLTNAFGGGLFWIKFWPSLMGALTYLLVGRLILSLGGKWFALVLGFLPFIFGAYLRVNYLFQPNCLDIFFWTLMAYGLVRYVQSERPGNGGSEGPNGPEATNGPGRPGWLYLAGIAMGLGMMSKYSMLFFAVSLGGGLLLTPQRRVLSSRHFWFAMGVGLLLFLPNGLWQWRHGFPIVYHMNELKRTQLQYVGPSAFLSDQLLLNLPCLFVWLSGLYAVGFTGTGKPYRFIGWAFVIVIILLTGAHGKGYYALGAYPVLFAFGAAGLERWTAMNPDRRAGATAGDPAARRRLTGRLTLRCLMIAVSGSLGYVFVTIALPFLPPPQLAAYYARTSVARNSGALHWEDLRDHPLPQDFADMLGWQEMTSKTAKVYQRLDSAEKCHTMIFCDNYGQAGALSYYGPRYHLPQIYSTEASFLYWIPDSVERLDNIEVFILVTNDENEMSYPFLDEFKSVELADSVTNPYARERRDLIILFKGPSDKFRQEFQQKVWHYKARSTAKGTNGQSPIG